MKVVKEAYTEHCKVVVDPEYVTIEHFPTATGVEPVHMSRKEAQEVVEWLSHELGRILPEVIQMVPSADLKTYEVKKPAKAPDGPVYEPGARSATQTHEMKVGDPNLAYRAGGGRTGQAGDGASETIDLAALAAKVGKF